MKKSIILILSSLLFFNCSNSPVKLLEKGDQYINDLEFNNAVQTYQKIVDQFPNDSLAQTAQYNIAWIALNTYYNYTNGYAILRDLAEKHPNTLIGKSASKDIQDFPKWIMIKTTEFRADTALTDAMKAIDYLTNNFKENEIIPEALYLKGNIYLNDLKDYYRALNTYQEIIHKYGKSNFGPMSQFMIGYIHANVQANLPKAKLAYEYFLQNYPEHELAPSVQFELEYLGKQINNIDDLSSRTQSN